MIKSELMMSIYNLPEKSAVVKKYKNGYSVEIYGKSHITPCFILKFNSMRRVDLFLAGVHITKIKII